MVVGGTREELERHKFREVGRDFPVFLHPQTHEEHALARRERKTAPGYRGFSVEFGPEVTLEEDLGRRDLTINAMARDPDGTLVDPPRRKARPRRAALLRHVSEAFVEDPVRVLRLARFAARFAAAGISRGARHPRADGSAWRSRTRSMRWSPSACGRNPRKLWREASPARVLPGAARMRRSRTHLSGDRRAVRRPAARAMASGNRYRSAHADGARPGFDPERRFQGAVRRAGS